MPDLILPGVSLPWVDGEVLIRLRPDTSIYIDQVTTDLAIPPKKINPDDLKEAIMGAWSIQQVETRKTTARYRLGQLPQGCLEVSPILTTDDDPVGAKITDYWAVVERPAFIGDFAFNSYENRDTGDEFWRIGYPRTIFIVQVSDVYQKCTGMHVWAIRGTEPISDETTLFHYPFTNIYADGGVCMGTMLTRTKVADLKDVDQVVNMFFRSINTGSLNNSARNSQRLGLHEMLRANQDRPFDENLLVAAGITYKDAVAGRWKPVA